MPAFDAVLVLSFGGPEKPEDVIPFLENVLRGRNVPRDRLLAVAEHYYHFGGRSPINDQNRQLVAALRQELTATHLGMPVYWGNRNWHPFLSDTLSYMRDQGVKRALVFVTSAFGSYSGCRQYLEDMDKARADLGAGAPELFKLRSFFNHPGYIETMADRIRIAFDELPPAWKGSARLVFTAHSVPVSMTATSPYVQQVLEACRLTANALSIPEWSLAYQSRSGPPSQRWLEPDIRDELSHLAANGVKAAVIAPIGFVSDHMEVIYDLDTDARTHAEQLGLHISRAQTAGSHPRFVRMIRELIDERVNGSTRLTLGACPAAPDECPADCCVVPRRP